MQLGKHNAIRKSGVLDETGTRDRLFFLSAEIKVWSTSSSLFEEHLHRGKFWLCEVISKILFDYNIRGSPLSIYFFEGLFRDFESQESLICQHYNHIELKKPKNSCDFVLSLKTNSTKKQNFKTSVNDCLLTSIFFFFIGCMKSCFNIWEIKILKRLYWNR